MSIARKHNKRVHWVFKHYGGVDLLIKTEQGNVQLITGREIAQWKKKDPTKETEEIDLDRLIEKHMDRMAKSNQYFSRC